MDSDLLTSYDAAVDFLVKRADFATNSPCSYRQLPPALAGGRPKNLSKGKGSRFGGLGVQCLALVSNGVTGKAAI